MVETNVITIKWDMYCGHCLNILLGNDEQICPSCGALVDFSDGKEMTDEEFGILLDGSRNESMEHLNTEGL